MSELGGERACTIGLGKEWSERKPAFHCEREIVFTAQPRRPRPRSAMSAQRRFAASARLSAPPPSLTPSGVPATGKSLSGEFYAGVGIATMFTRSEFQVRTACGNCA